MKDKNYFFNSQKLVSIKVTKTTILFNVLEELWLQIEHVNAYWSKHIPPFEPYKENNLFLKTIENIPNTPIDYLLASYEHCEIVWFLIDINPYIRSLWELEIKIFLGLKVMF